MRKFPFLSWLLGLVFLCSCSEESKTDLPEPPVFNKPTSEVKVFTEAEANYVTGLPSEESLVFSSNTPESVLPEVGTIIQLPISEHTPFGFLGRVTSVTKGENIVVNTEQVPLDVAYPNLSVDGFINSSEEVMSVEDEDGTPMEYEIVTLGPEDIAQTRAGGKGELDDWNGQKVLRVKVKNDWGGISVGGHLSFGLGFVNNGIDCKDGLKYLNLEANPYIDAKVQIKAELKKNDDNVKRSKRVKFTFRLVAGPVVIPITVYANFVIGAKGEITTTNTLQFQKSCHVYVKYINEKWSKGVESTGKYDGNPWFVNEFDFKGELYGGVECGIIFGLYSATTGVGINLLPKVSLTAEAKLENLNPFKVNPLVTIAGKLESSIFCIAELFGFKLGKWQLDLPEATFISRQISLFPNISNFAAIGSSSSAEISYQSDSYYLLEAFNLVKTGTEVYKQDKTTVVDTQFPASNKTDRLGVRYYTTKVNGLQPGTTYYAAPIITFLKYKWVGDKQEIMTEAKYHLGFRCSNHDYDVIEFDFDLNNKSGNVIDFTTEASDYDGSPMRVHITATYDSYNKTLDGIFDFFFYNDPDQQRKDSFSVSLASDDSGYVDCGKVIDNGGCYAALRIYKKGTSAARKAYAEPLVEDDCNVRIFNKNYTR